MLANSYANSVLNVKVLVGAFNPEKALVEAFSMIVKTGCGTNGAIHSTIKKATRSPGGSQAQVRGQESPVQV